MTTLFETDGRAAYYTLGPNIYGFDGQRVFYIAEQSDSTVCRHGDGCPVGWVADRYVYWYDGRSPLYFGVD